MKILLAVDGSSHTKKMLAYLSTHSELLGSQHRYTLFTAQPPLPARAKTALGAGTVKAYHSEEAAKVLAPVEKFLRRHGIEAQVLWKLGAPGMAIAKLAQQGRFDLLVMGSHGHGALGNLVMGSVATQVLSQCDTPVLLVR